MELDYKYYSDELPFDFNYYSDPTSRIDCNGNEISKVIPNEVMNIEYNHKIKKADKYDYLIASTSGLISSALNFLWNDDISLIDASEWGNEKVEDFVKKTALIFSNKKTKKNFNYKDLDIKDAIEILEKRFPMSGDELINEFGGGLQHHFRDFTHHPSIIGLVFSVLSQFTLKGYGTDTEGKFVSYELPYKKYVGKDVSEKLIIGIFMWLMHLISDMAGSSSTLSRGTGIPGPLLSMLKEFSALPIVRSLEEKYREKSDNIKDITFSQILSKLFNGTHDYLNQEGKKVKFDLRTEVGIVHHIVKGTLPVITNEIITRALFTLRCLIEEINSNNIKSVNDIRKINVDNIIPSNDKRQLIRMMTVSSAVFVAITTSVTAYKSAKRSGGNKVLFATNMILNINYAGIGRFVLAIKADSRYIAYDIEEVKNRYLERQFLIYQTSDIKMLDCFGLSNDGANALYLLKKQFINYDIDATKNKKHVSLKREWLNNFSNREIHDMDFDSSNDLYKFVSDFKHKNPREYSVIILELSAFKPYYPYEAEELEKYKNLKYNFNEVKSKFFNECPAITKKEFRIYEDAYQKGLSDIKDTTKKVVITLGAAVVISIATGGLAMYYAPNIAVLLAGGSLVGLHGAALTSASLAMIGGGSLAAGGLGMAGGTAIITGGGALLSAVSVSASMSMAIAMSTSKVFTLKECAKILALCKIIIIKLPNKEEILHSIKKSLLHNMSLVIKNIESINANKDIDNKLKKDMIKNSVDSFNYMSKCYKKINKNN